MLCEETIHKGSAVSCEKVSLHGHNVKETVEGLERLLSGQSTLAGPAEDPGSVPSTYMEAHRGLSLQFQWDLRPSSGFCGHSMHMVHIHKCM